MSEQQHIMIIDDDVQLVNTVKTLLEGVGYRVSHSYQSEKGMELAKETKPDLILLDILFAGPPGPDGVELSRRLHRDPVLKDIPVIILSGAKKVLDMPVALGPDEDYMPVKAFLEKPVKPDKLLAEIEKILGPRN
jgi:CheY-like chemotaxis protein